MTTETKNGKCRDCAQGILITVAALGSQGGFELYIEDGRPCHWFCRYCGSNHVEIQCPTCAGSGKDKAHQWPDGSFASCEDCDGYGHIQQGDNYPDSPTYQTDGEGFEVWSG